MAGWLRIAPPVEATRSRHLGRFLRATLVLALVVAAGVGAGACKNGEITFLPPPPASSWPIEWRPELALEMDFPKSTKPFVHDKKLAGEAFLNDHVRVTPELLLAWRDVVMVGTNGMGRFSVVRYQLAPVDTAAQTHPRELYRMTLTQIGPDSNGTIVMGLDHRLRMVTYDSRIQPIRGGELQTLSRSIGRFIEGVELDSPDGKDPYPMGYKVAGEFGEEYVPSVEPLVPIELVSLLPAMAPKVGMEGSFSMVSVTFRGVFVAEIDVRPEIRARPKALTRIIARTPMPKDYAVLVDYTSRPSLVWAADAGRMKWHPGTKADLEHAEDIVRILRRERGGALLFNGARLFSGWQPDGRRIPSAELAGQQPDAHSWLSMDTSPLGLAIDNTSGRSTELIMLSDPASAGKSVGGRGVLRSGQRQLVVSLDLLREGVTLEQAAEQVIAAYLAVGQRLEVNQSESIVDGKPAIRIDMLEEITTRHRDGVSKATLFHSFFLIADNGALLRLEFTMGPGWSSWAKELAQTCATVRFTAPKTER